LSSVAGETPAARSPPTLSFGDEYRIFGEGGCNQFYGAYGSDSGVVTIRNLTATGRTCEQAVMTQEQIYFEMLRGARSVVLTEDGRLIIVGPAGRQLMFTRP
jgi:heat shock protein HslJ